MEVSPSAWARDTSLHSGSRSPWTSRKCNGSFQKDIARDSPGSWSFPPSCLNTCNKMSSAVVLAPQMQSYKVWPIHWIMVVPSILSWIQPTVMACSRGAPLSFFQGPYVHYRLLTLAQFGRISRRVCSKHVPRNKNFFFYQVRTERWTSSLADLPVFWWWSELPCNFCLSCYELILSLLE